MKNDKFGRTILNEQDIFNLFMKDPTRKLTGALTEQPILLDPSLQLSANISTSVYKNESHLTKAEFDEVHRCIWAMPESYKQLDIAQFVLNQCKTDVELQRVGDELLKYQDRDMFPLLQYLKFLVDTMRKNNIVWGVGRGSSVSSYVLYLIGVHRIDSIYYDLSIDEFLK